MFIVTFTTTLQTILVTTLKTFYITSLIKTIKKRVKFLQSGGNPIKIKSEFVLN